MEEDGKGVNSFSCYVRKIGNERIKQEDERLGALGHYHVSLSNTWRCMCDWKNL